MWYHCVGNSEQINQPFGHPNRAIQTRFRPSAARICINPINPINPTYSNCTYDILFWHPSGKMARFLWHLLCKLSRFPNRNVTW